MSTSYQSTFRSQLFLEKNIVITGGGSGIGRCTAHELASLGAAVWLVGRSVEKLDAVVAEIRRAGGQAHAAACDIRDEPAVQHTVAQFVKAAGRIDGLVNNAGGQFPAALRDISAKGWDAVVKTNLTGGFLMARECLNQSMIHAGGAIVNIVADFWGSMPQMGHSGAARAGMVSFTETAAFEWAPYGVRVNAVAPGYIASSGMDRYPPEMAEAIRATATQVPMQRMGVEAEVAAGIVFLLSPASSYVTGTVLRIDGGRPQVRHGNPPKPLLNPAPAVNGFHLASIPRVLRDEQ